MMPDDCPRLDFAGLAEFMAGVTDRRIGPAIVRRYGQQAPGGGRVISVELHGWCLALVKPGQVRFPGLRALTPGNTRGLLERQEWLSRVVADNGLGKEAVPVRVTLAPHVRHRVLAIDGDKTRLVCGQDYDIPRENEQEVA